MRTILLSVLGFVGSIFFAFKKGATDEKQKQEIRNVKLENDILRTEKGIRDSSRDFTTNDYKRMLKPFRKIRPHKR